MTTILKSAKTPTGRARAAIIKHPEPPERPADRAAVSANNRERFLKACRCEPVERPPVWLMRQAGRALPEYRELKKKYTFVELVQNPELATEVTLQPIRRFGFDAAILFSDILVIAEALGQRYEFRDSGGISMEFLLQNEADIERLELSAVTARLQYVAQALRLIKSELRGQTALLGFSGSPWTLANFMLEGGGVKEYTKAKALFYSDPKLFSRLLTVLTAAVTDYLNLQIEAGAEVLQIFDSMGGLLSDGSFERASGVWMKQIISGLEGDVPVVVFSKGTHGNWTNLAAMGAQVVGVDWNVSLAAVRRLLPANVAVQGNLDPFLLATTPEAVANETKRLLSEMKGLNGHIFNLGHGVPPNAKLENIQALVNTVRGAQ
jgi:uroporphyrinogen decarboxylase